MSVCHNTIQGAERMEDMKRFFVYQLERLGREETLCHFSIVFDCRCSAFIELYPPPGARA